MAYNVCVLFYLIFLGTDVYWHVSVKKKVYLFSNKYVEPCLNVSANSR
jgi:hypothetical protein